MSITLEIKTERYVVSEGVRVGEIKEDTNSFYYEPTILSRITSEGLEEIQSLLEALNKQVKWR